MQGSLVAGRYRLADAIGSGGMGRVWRAHDELLHRAVAIKELTAALYVSESDQTVLLARTRAEARAAARINHSAVVTVHDVLEHDGRPWIVMELVEGRSLADAVKEDGRVEPTEAARIGLWVLRALRAAHSAGVLHRDVKPGNVLLSHDGRVLLTDFGIAQIEGDATITRTGEVVGSVDYLAPERVRGQDPGPSSDLWALAATLYTAVEGRSPFRRTTPLTTLQAVVEEEAAEPHHAGPLGPVIAALLRKDPADRPDMTEAEHLLAEAAEGRRPNDAQAYVPTQFTGPGGGAGGRPAAGSGTGGHPSAGAGTGGYPGSGSGTGGHPSAGAGTGGYAGSGSGTGGHLAAGAGTGGHSAAGAGTGGRPSAGAGTGGYPAAGSGAGGYPGSGTAATSYGVGASEAATPVPGSAEAPFGYPQGHHLSPLTVPTAVGPPAGSGQGQPPAPAHSSQPAQGPAAPTRSARRRRLRTLALVVVVAALVGGGTALTLQNWHDDRRSDSGSAASGASPTDDPGPTPTGKPAQQGAVPDSWEEVTDPLGFGLSLPEGWERQVFQDDGDLKQIDYTPDGGEHFLRIAVDASPDFDDPYAHQIDLEVQLQRLVDYKRVTLERNVYRDREGAEWEYTWTALAKDTEFPGPRRAIEETYIARDGTEYVIYMSSPAEDWETASQQFKSVLRSWREPTGTPPESTDTSPESTATSLEPTRTS